MTDQEINIAIAEIHGTCPVCGWVTAGGHRCSHSPYYVRDLDAVASVVKTLRIGSLSDPSEYDRYQRWLIHIAGDELDAMDATAKQRCEAILRAMGKWRE